MRLVETIEGSSLDLTDGGRSTVVYTADGLVWGVVRGSIAKCMSYRGEFKSMFWWEAVAMAVWLNDTSRDGLYYDPNPNRTLAASACWGIDKVRSAELRESLAARSNGHGHPGPAETPRAIRAVG